MKASEFLKLYRWCQGAYAVNIDDVEVSIYDDEAIGFCITSAVVIVAKNQAHYLSILDKLVEKTGYKSMVRWNDEPGRTKTEVIELLESVNNWIPALIKRFPWTKTIFNN